MAESAGIFDSKGNLVGKIENEQIFFDDTLQGKLKENGELFDNEEYYLGRWTGKEALGKIWDLGFDRFGCLIGTTLENEDRSPIDPGRFLVLNTFSNIVGSSDSPLGCAALLLIYYQEKYPVGHRRASLAKEDESGEKKGAASSTGISENLVRLHLANLLESLQSLRIQFKGWMNFYKTNPLFQDILENLATYEREIIRDLDGQVDKWKKYSQDDEFLVKNRAAATITNEFFYSSNWQNIKKALDQRLIPHFDTSRVLADRLIHDFTQPIYKKLAEARLDLSNPFRKKIISFFHMDVGYHFTINYTRTPVAVIGIPYHLSLAPWNWSGVITQLGMEFYHNISGFKTEIKALFFDVLEGKFPDQVNIHWFAWRSRVFADMFAIFAMGPAYTMAFQEEHLPTIGYIQADLRENRGRWNYAPLTYACFLAQIEVLRALGFTKEASDFANTWANFFGRFETIHIDGEAQPVKEFTAPVKTLVERLLNHPFRTLGRKQLGEFFVYEAGQSERIVSTAQDLARGQVGNLETIDMHRLFPAIRLAFEFTQEGATLRRQIFK